MEPVTHGMERATKLKDNYGIACEDCVVCECNIPRNQSLNRKQLSALRNMPRTVACENNTKNLYEEICRVMYLLNSVPFSNAYAEVFKEFIRYIVFFVVVNYTNVHIH